MSFKKPIIGITADPDPERISLKEEYALAVLKAGGLPVAIPVTGDPLEALESLDGILIPGGDDIAPSCYGEKERVPLKLVSTRRTEFEISLIRAVFCGQKPLLAICYGMQLINVALGGSLYQDLESELSGKDVFAIEHRRGMHEIIVKEAGLLPEGRFTVNSSHHQGVSRPADALCPIAFSEDGLVEALCSRERRFFAGVQWHPERLFLSADPLAEKIFTSFIEAARGR